MPSVSLGETTAQVRAHVVNDAVVGHDDAVTALFYLFDVTDLAATPRQAANILEPSASGLSAFAQNRQRKVGIATAWGVAPWDVDGAFPEPSSAVARSS